MKKLGVYWEQKLVGTISEIADGKIAFSYTQSWVKAGFALSLSLPLREEKYTEKAHKFFANLLPEADYRREIERIFKVSSGNDLSLLEAIGGECAGAISIGSESLVESESGYLAEISDSELERIIETEGYHAISATGKTRLSLAGAQAKLPIYYSEKKFSLAYDGAPTSHILKFNKQNGTFPRLIENEFYLNQIAKALKFNVVNSELIQIGKFHALLVERYDRTISSSAWPVRIHQEDFCQALGVSYQKKYQKEGGPSFKECSDLVREHLQLSDVNQLLDWMFFNLITGNSDAHGKNLSLIYNDEFQLAPFYDLVCTRAYEGLDRHMAMSIGGNFDPDIIHWKNLEIEGKSILVTLPFLKSRLREMLKKMNLGIKIAKDAVINSGVPENKMEHVFLWVDKNLRKMKKRFEIE